jgi:hypothetical protein
VDPAEPGSADLAAALCALAGRRAAALESVSPGGLAAVDAPSSPAMVSDRALIGRLSARGLHLAGLSFDVTGVRVLARGTGRVTVVAQVATSAHRQVRQDGSIAAQIPASAPRVARLVLVAAPGGRGWLVQSVTGG